MKPTHMVFLNLIQIADLRVPIWMDFESTLLSIQLIEISWGVTMKAFQYDLAIINGLFGCM